MEISKVISPVNLQLLATLIALEQLPSIGWRSIMLHKLLTRLIKNSSKYITQDVFYGAIFPILLMGLGISYKELT